MLVKLPNTIVSSTANIDHISCKECIRKINSVPGNSETSIQFCKICNEDHALNKKILAKLNKKDTGGCCIIF